MRALVATLLVVAAATASAQSVSMGGSFGHYALLVIDG